jgi:steroid delta-isomerase
MATTEDIRDVVRQYVERVAAHEPGKVADLFADGATIEDPVGTELKTDRAAIVDFFAVIAGMEETTTELMWCKAAADTAVFQFRLRVSTAGQGYEVTPVDIMVFDDDAKIVSMRAVWDPANDLRML